MKKGYPVSYVNQILVNDGLVLSAHERENIITPRIDNFNSVIMNAADKSSDDNIHLIDIGEKLNNILTNEEGGAVDGVIFNRRWRKGNGFTLDGVHGSHTAHALIANSILEWINSNKAIFGITEDVPLYDLPTILAKDPYVDNDIDGWLRGPDYKVSGRTKLLFLFKDLDKDSGIDALGRANIDALKPEELWDLISLILLEELLGF